MEQEKKPIVLPLPTIRRYPLYLRAINARINRGETLISSAALAQELDLDTVLARKDLAMAGVPGKPRLGYPAQKLAEAINRVLGWNKFTNAALVGVGSLGNALLGYKGFLEHNLSISAAFDCDPQLLGQLRHEVKVHSMDELSELVKKYEIKIGILTVPDCAANECARQLVEAGVLGIWNFTAVKLELPPEIKVQQVDLAQSLAVLSHTITTDTPSPKN